MRAFGPREKHSILLKFFDERGERLSQPREALVLLEVRPHVAQCARNVLNVHGIPASGRLIAERAERFEIALKRHQVESASKFTRVGARALQREKVRDEI